ncbi:hypothetical protein [Glycomyces sp. YM15]|uniref:hypothetical protein n=1 Tax=Glycomyces sp. YM15 TaxID=2800446 RepID=UPI001962DAF9|nr:hypothetical protein [Glycomyces sp. YM15]
MQRLIRVFEDFVYRFDRGVDVPLEAAHALVRGLETPGLVELAGMHRNQTLDIEDLIPQVIDELGIAIAARSTVVERRASEIASGYLAGDIAFIDGLSGVLSWQTQYFEEGYGYRCCDSMLWLEPWLISVDDDGDTTYWFGSQAAAKEAFREHCSAMVEGRKCPKPEKSR